MGFLDNLGVSITGVIDSISGKNQVALSQQAVDIQAQIARDTLANELAAQQLKYNPELAKQRTKQVALIGIPILIIIGAIIYVKFIR